MPTKTSKIDRLKASKFFGEITSIAFALNYFVEQVGDESQSYENRASCRGLLDENWGKWEVAKSAIHYITGKTYAFTRTDDHYGIVNEADENDWLYCDKVNSTLHLGTCVNSNSCMQISRSNQLTSMLGDHQKLSRLVSEISHGHTSQSPK